MAPTGSVFVTGAAGFIGFHVSRRLLTLGFKVIGVDNLNTYYDPTLKLARIAQFAGDKQFTFEKVDVSDQPSLAGLFDKYKPRLVVHLAAQAGVRHSISHPHDYIGANIIGFLNILEECRKHTVDHLVYASSSSVYGANQKLPYSVEDRVDHPISLYAATKKSNELMAHAYSHLYGIKTTGLRFFTVYGPWGRPDMAIAKFSHAIAQDQPIDVYNFGRMKRDFTFIDDIVDGVIKALNRDENQKNPKISGACSELFRIYNLGNQSSMEVGYLISLIEAALGKKAITRMLPMQSGDMLATDADISLSQRDLDYQPSTPIEEGIRIYADWFKEYFGYQSVCLRA